MISFSFQVNHQVSYYKYLTVHISIAGLIGIGTMVFIQRSSVLFPRKKNQKKINFFIQIRYYHSIVDQHTVVTANNGFVYLLLLISVLSKIKYNHDPFKFSSFFIMFIPNKTEQKKEIMYQ